MIKSSRIIKAVDPNLEPLLAALRRFRSAFLAGSLEFFIRTNLTVPQCRALYAIGRAGRMSGRQLATEMEVSPAAIVSLCDRLERDGYLRRVPALGDREIGPDEELQAPGEKGRTEAPKGCKQRLQIRIHSINDST